MGLVKANAAVTPEELKSSVSTLSKTLQSMLTAADTPVKASALFGVVKDIAANVKAFEKVARAKVLRGILENGVQYTPTGSIRLDLGDGTAHDAIISKSGVDAKKLQALLRAKNVRIESGMGTAVSYVVDQAKLDKLRINGVVSDAELESIQYDRVYKIGKAHPLREDGVAALEGSTQPEGEEQDDE